MIRIFEQDNPSNSLEIEPLGKPNLPAVVVFYRSKINATLKNKKNVYGNKDSEYDGSFGFDRYDQDIMAEGLITNYEKLEDVETKRDTTSTSNDYLCSYLSLFPPNTDGRLDTVILYVQLEEDIDRTDGNPDIGGIYFQSSDPSSIEITGTTEHKLLKETVQAKKIPLKISENPKPITIKCLQQFSEAITITATTSNGTVIGQMIVVANAEVYKLSIQPVIITLGNATSNSLIEVNTSTIPHINITKFDEHLNKRSFNQALIISEVAVKSHKITLSKTEVSQYLKTEDGKKYLSGDDTERSFFNNSIESHYAKLIKGGFGNSDEDKKNKAYVNSGTYVAVKDFLSEFDKRFDYNINASNPFKEAKKRHKDKEITNAIGHRKLQEKLTSFKVSEAKMKADLTAQGINTDDISLSFNDNSIPKQGTVYVFYYPDIEASYAENSSDLTSKVPGYTKRENGISHIFKSCFSLIDAVVHEIGHGLGLPHPFDKNLGSSKDPSIKTEEDYDKEINILESELEKLKEDETAYNKGIQTMTRSGESNLAVFYQYENLDNFYKSVKRYISNETLLAKKTYNTYLNFLKINQRTRDIEKVEVDINAISTMGNGITTTDITQIKTDILIKEQEITTLKQLKAAAPKDNEVAGKANYKAQSKTLENYMDYDFNNNGTVDPDFERKTLTKQQWDLIRTVGSNNGYFKS